MLKNTELKDIGTILEKADSVLLFPHINPDGDSTGACTALCGYLRSIGKDAWILAEGQVPEYIAFLRTGMWTEDTDVIRDPDVCMCVDCCETNRFEGRLKAFLSGKLRISIDHHQVRECAWDKYYIDPDEAAASQIIYKLFMEMGWPLDRSAAEALYTGIVSDTGCFRYSNTTSESHRIAAELMEFEVDINKVSVYLFQNIDPKNAAIKALAVNKMELVAGGKGAISCLSAAERESCGAAMEDTDNVVEELRNIKGVEISAFLKEDGDAVRVSMRAKTDGDVAAISRKFGGGGHAKAAGCTMNVPLDEAVGLIRQEVIKAFSADTGENERRDPCSE